MRCPNGCPFVSRRSQPLSPLCWRRSCWGGFIYLSEIRLISYVVLAAVVPLTLSSMLGWRYFRRKRIQKAFADGLTCRNALIIGPPTLARSFWKYLNEHRHLGYIVAGLVVDEREKEKADDVLGTIDNLAAIARARFIDDVIVCGGSGAMVKRNVAEARRGGRGVRG